MHGKNNKMKYILCEVKMEEGTRLILLRVDAMYFKVVFALWALFINFSGNIKLVDLALCNSNTACL